MNDDSFDIVFPYSMRIDFDRTLEGAASAYSVDSAEGGEGRQDGEPMGRQDSGQVGRQDCPAQADNNEGGAPTALLQTILRGQQCCARVPERSVSEETAKAYKATFVRMWGSGSLDPYSSGIAFATHYHRRAA